MTDAIDRILDKVDRLAGIVERITKASDKIPRLIEMLGVSWFAGNAAEKLGGDFLAGALGGAVADGLAHSSLPHNQIGAIPLAAYFTGLGLMNIGGHTESPEALVTYYGNKGVPRQFFVGGRTG